MPGELSPLVAEARLITKPFEDALARLRAQIRQLNQEFDKIGGVGTKGGTGGGTAAAARASRAQAAIIESQKKARDATIAIQRQIRQADIEFDRQREIRLANLNKAIKITAPPIPKIPSPPISQYKQFGDVLGTISSAFLRIATFSVAAGIIVRAFFAITDAIKGTVSEGIRFNAAMELSQVSLAGILGTTREVVDAQGKVVSHAAALPFLLKEAAKQQRDVLIADAETLGTGEELLGVYEQVLALSANQLGTDKDRLKVAELLTNVEKIAGLSGQQLVEKTRQIFTLDTKRVQSFLVRLNLSVAEARESKKQLGYLQLLLEKGKAYDSLVNHIRASWEGVTSTASTFFSLAAGAGFKGVFEALKQIVGGFGNELRKIEEQGGFKALVGISDEDLQALGATVARWAADFIIWLAQIIAELIQLVVWLNKIDAAVNEAIAPIENFFNRISNAIDNATVSVHNWLAGLVKMGEGVVNPEGLGTKTNEDAENLAKTLDKGADAGFKFGKSLVKAGDDGKKSIDKLPGAIANIQEQASQAFRETSRLIDELSLEPGRFLDARLKEIEDERTKIEEGLRRQKISPEQPKIKAALDAETFAKETQARLQNLKEFERIEDEREDIVRKHEDAILEIRQTELHAEGALNENRKADLELELQILQSRDQNVSRQIELIQQIAEEERKSIELHQEDLRATLAATQAKIVDAQAEIEAIKAANQATIEGLRISIKSVETYTDLKLILDSINAAEAASTREIQAKQDELDKLKATTGALQADLDKGEGDIARNAKKARESISELGRTTIRTADIMEDAFAKVFEGLAKGKISFKKIFKGLQDDMISAFSRGFAEILRKKLGFENTFIDNVHGVFGPDGIISNLLGRGGAAAGIDFFKGFASTTGDWSDLLNQGTGANTVFKSAGFNSGNLFGGGFLDSIGKFFGSGGFLGGILGKAGSAIKGFFGSAGNQIGSFLGNFAGGGLSKLFGLKNNIGGQIGGQLGGIAGSFGGPIGSFIGSAIGKILGNAIGSLFQPGRIATEKKNIEKFFGEVFKGLKFKVVKENAAAAGLAAFKEADAALIALGAKFTTTAKGGNQGTIKRFAAQFAGNMKQMGASTEEVKKKTLELAQAMNFDLSSGIETINALIGNGVLSMKNFDKAIGDARKNLKKYGDTSKLTAKELSDLSIANGIVGSKIITLNEILAGTIAIASGFNPLIDAVSIANNALADSFEKTAKATNLFNDQVRTLEDQIRSGKLSIEEGISALNKLREAAGLTKLDLKDFKIDTAAIQQQIDIIQQEFSTLSEDLKNAILSGIRQGTTNEDIAKNLRKQLYNALLETIVQGFVDGFIKAQAVLGPLTAAFTKSAGFIADFAAGKISQAEFLKGIQDLFSGLKPTVEKLAAAIGITVGEFRKLLENAGILSDIMDDTAGSAKEAADNAQGLADDLRKAARDLLLSAVSPLTPKQRFAEAFLQFQQAAAKARGGDIEAARKLPELGNALLEEARKVFKSSPKFEEFFNLVRGTLLDVANIFGEDLGNVAEDQLTTLNQIRDILNKILVSSGLAPVPVPGPGEGRPGRIGGTQQPVVLPNSPLANIAKDQLATLNQIRDILDQILVQLGGTPGHANTFSAAIEDLKNIFSSSGISDFSATLQGIAKSLGLENLKGVVLSLGIKDQSATLQEIAKSLSALESFASVEDQVRRSLDKRISFSAAQRQIAQSVINVTMGNIQETLLAATQRAGNKNMGVSGIAGAIGGSTGSFSNILSSLGTNSGNFDFGAWFASLTPFQREYWYSFLPAGYQYGMQHGGIVQRPTVSMIGEHGPEAVIPLSRMSHMMPDNQELVGELKGLRAEVAMMRAERGAEGPGVVHVVGDVIVDGERMGQFIERKTQRSLQRGKLRIPKSSMVR